MRLELDQQREYQEAVKAGWNDTALALLRQVHAAEKLKAASDGASSAMLNVASGYKIKALQFKYMTYGDPSAITPSPAPSPVNPSSPAAVSPSRSAEPETPIILVMDGQQVGRGVVRGLRKEAARQIGDSNKWAEVQF